MLPTWTKLETSMREQVGRLLEPLLDAEIVEFLGRVKGERRATAGTPPG